MATFSSEQLNFFKFSTVVLDEFPIVLRKVFVCMWDTLVASKHSGQKWDNSGTVLNLFLSNEGGAAKVPTLNKFIEEWDCTALFKATLFAKTFAMPDGSGGVATLNTLYVKPHSLPSGTFHPSVLSPSGNQAETFALALDQLRLLRNTLCHQNSTKKIDKTTLDKFLLLAKDAFAALGQETCKIDDIGKLGEEDFPTARVQQLEDELKREKAAAIKFKQIEDHLKQIESEVKEVGTDVKDVKTGLGNVGSDVKEIKADVQAMRTENPVKPARLRIHIDAELVPGPDGENIGMVVTSQVSQFSLQDSEIRSSSSQQQDIDGSATSLVTTLTNQSVANATQQLLNRIAEKYLQVHNLSTPESFSDFENYMARIRKAMVVRTDSGSLIITVECGSLQILDELWEDYRTGHLNEMAQKLLVTEDILKEFNLLEVKLTTTILEEEYRTCREYFLQFQGKQNLHSMATLIGVLVDVSGSMKCSIGKRPNQEGGSWVRSIFNVVDGLIKHDVSSSNHVFALGFGAEKEPVSFDLLNTIEVNASADCRDKREILEEILGILEASGAPRVRTWGKMDVLDDVVKKSDACYFLQRLKNNSEFERRFVDDCLPKTCREVEISPSSFAKEATFWATGWVPVVGDSMQNYAIKDSVKDVVKKGKKLLSDRECVTFVKISPDAIMDVHKASEILHGGIGEDELTEQRIDELMKTVEPFIYGDTTPLMRTFKDAKDLFARPEFEHYNKLLFILSDGQSSDGSDPPIKEMADLGVKTVCCYITKNPIDDPKRLYSTERESWDGAAKLMFKMSSTITTQMIPLTIFLKRGWNIDFANNETRLFVQLNHPDIIEDICALVCCQDALADFLSSVSLDLYINQANDGFVLKEQVGGTSYANASAALLHLSMQRIVGREGGYPDFFDLRKKIIAKYGEHGANTLKVLQEVCPQYRLHCQKTDVLGAMKAVTAKRPVLATFRLTDEEWGIFSDFYRKNPKGVLSSSILDRKRRRSGAKLGGHAVVLIGFNSESLRLMNWFGSDWADGGFFRVSDADVLGLRFVDVYWTTEDLKPSEIRAYDLHGAEIAQKLISKLKGLQTALYRCPLCRETSKVVEFSGHDLEIECPKCGEKFNTKHAGDDLALNMYLLSCSSQGKRKKCLKKERKK